HPCLGWVTKGHWVIAKLCPRHPESDIGTAGIYAYTPQFDELQKKSCVTFRGQESSSPCHGTLTRNSQDNTPLSVDYLIKPEGAAIEVGRMQATLALPTLKATAGTQKSRLKKNGFWSFRIYSHRD